MSEDIKPNYDGFLKGLAALTSKYGIAIGGCGCCGSPYLRDGEKPGGVNGSTTDTQTENLIYYHRDGEPEAVIAVAW